MKITAGPTIEKYASYFDIPVEEVLNWANAYINKPEWFPETEPTEKERAESIKQYIKSQVEGNINERIRARIAEAKQKKPSADMPQL
jgi:hypothetical protein